MKNNSETTPLDEEQMTRIPSQKRTFPLGRRQRIVPERKDVKDQRISSAIEILAMTDLSAGVDIDEIARVVNLSRSRFRHLFTKQVGTSPHNYIRYLRMRQAKSLLENTFLRVKQVMFAVGYKDPSHFVRDYKHIFSTTPSVARSSVLVNKQSQCSVATISKE
jgi:transcriptional regulator GlxA family with amidase domain